MFLCDLSSEQAPFQKIKFSSTPGINRPEASLDRQPPRVTSGERESEILWNSLVQSGSVSRIFAAIPDPLDAVVR